MASSTPKTPVRAAIYLRISLDHTGEGLAVERQLEDCEKIAAERGWEIVEVYEDNSISAYNKAKARPAYERMVLDYTAGRFSALVCWDLDRLTRQPRQLEEWIDAAEDRGLRLVTANGEADLSTDGGRMYARIKAAVARAEMERKGARQSSAQKQRAAKGRPPRGVRATGYTLDGEIIPEEAAAIQAAFQAFADGASLRAVAAALNGDEPTLRKPGDKTPMQDIPASVPRLTTRSGKRWIASTLYGVLRSPRYAGWSMLKGEIVRDSSGAPIRGQWPEIVPDDLWLRVQKRLNDPTRKKNKVGTDRRHLGSGLYLCGVCGRKIISHGARYRCPSECLARTREIVDLFVTTTIEERLARPDLRDLLVVTEDHSETVAALDAKIADERARIIRARSDYKDGKIEADLYAEIRAEAEAGIKNAETERLGLTTTNPAAAAIIQADDPAEAFQDADLFGKRAVIDTLCEVRLYSSPRGRKTFDPETVKITPRQRTPAA